MPRDCLSDPEEAIDVWPRGGCWLQDEACRWKGFPKHWGRVAKSAAHGFKLFKVSALANGRLGRP